MMSIARVPQSEETCGIHEYFNCRHKQCDRYRRVSVFPLGLAVAREPMLRKGSFADSIVARSRQWLQARSTLTSMREEEPFTLCDATQNRLRILTKFEHRNRFHST